MIMGEWVFGIRTFTIAIKSIKSEVNGVPHDPGSLGQDMAGRIHDEITWVSLPWLSAEYAGRSANPDDGLPPVVLVARTTGNDAASSW